jgi:hypothetical protein
LTNIIIETTSKQDINKNTLQSRSNTNRDKQEHANQGDHELSGSCSRSNRAKKHAPKYSNTQSQNDDLLESKKQASPKLPVPQEEPEKLKKKTSKKDTDNVKK